MNESEEKQWAEKEKAEQEAAKKLFWDTVDRLAKHTATPADLTYAANRLKSLREWRDSACEDYRLIYTEIARVKKPCDLCLESGGITGAFDCSMMDAGELIRNIVDELIAYHNAGISVPAAEEIRKRIRHKEEVIP